tara:strand:- start:115 stop:423 length:309 start_codon:yes stop_codon:yes gene_type:complete
MNITDLARLDSLESLKLSTPQPLTDSYESGKVKLSCEFIDMSDEEIEEYWENKSTGEANGGDEFPEVWKVSELMDCGLSLDEARAAVCPIANGVGCEPSVGW